MDVSAAAHAEPLQRLTSFDRRTLKVIFQSLRAPELPDTEGEYTAIMLDQGGGLSAALTRRFFSLKGCWTGKAFRPLTTSQGEGYNMFTTRHGETQGLRMDTLIGPSAIDGQPAFILNYRGRHVGPVRWLVGELRSYQPGILLGMGTFGPRHPGWRKWRRIIPFVLTGPVRPYQSAVQSSQDRSACAA